MTKPFMAELQKARKSGHPFQSLIEDGAAAAALPVPAQVVQADNTEVLRAIGDLGAKLLRRDHVGGDAVDGRLIDTERLAAGEIFARQLDHHASIDRLSHAYSPSLAGPLPDATRRKPSASYFLPLAAATACQAGPPGSSSDAVKGAGSARSM